MTTTLGLSMIVKNEEKTLPHLFQSIDGIFDQIVIMDTGSQDRTIEVITYSKLKVQIIKAPWVDDFAQSRNQAFAALSTDLICWLDADDYLPSETQEYLKKLKTKSLDEHPAGYSFDYEYIVKGKNYPVIIMDRINVVRRDQFSLWKYPIYEQIEVKGEVVKIHQKISHMVDLELMPLKVERNLKLLEKMLAEDPQSLHALKYAGMLALSEGNLKIAQAHFEKLLMVDPQDDLVRVQLLQLSLEVGDDDLFDRYFNLELKNFDEFADIAALLGYYSERHSRSSVAVFYYERALDSAKCFNFHSPVAKRKFWMKTWPLKRLISLMRAKGDEEQLKKYKMLLLKYAGDP